MGVSLPPALASPEPEPVCQTQQELRCWRRSLGRVQRSRVDQMIWTSNRSSLRVHSLGPQSLTEADWPSSSTLKVDDTEDKVPVSKMALVQRCGAGQLTELCSDSALSGRESAVRSGGVTLPLCYTSGHSAGHRVTGREGRVGISPLTFLTEPEPKHRDTQRQSFSLSRVLSLSCDIRQLSQPTANQHPPCLRTLQQTALEPSRPSPAASSTRPSTEMVEP
ncbi:hypothetical protein INR49_008765 [Caranx melampygus]|nr:hypothetical protein INR49_008765 [Caranx melampygus]